MEEVGIEKYTAMADRDISRNSGVTMDLWAEERDRDRAVNVSAVDDPVEYLLSLDVGLRSFCFPRDGGRRDGSWGRLVDPVVAGSG